MKAIAARLLLGCATALLSINVLAIDLTGAGASFPYPVIAKWAESYHRQTGNRVNYQSIGSGGGIRQIKGRTVDFGATDRPLGLYELNESGLVQFPMILGGVVPIVNLQGIAPGQMKLTGQVLGDIYLGKITKWNAPEIAELNPEISLPDRSIAVVHRADSSGTSFLFTDFLAKTNVEFEDTVGAGISVKWPTGLGGKGNEGVAANVQRIRNSIGYVEFAFANRNNIVHVQLQNKDGIFVEPSAETFKEASAGVNWSEVPGFGLILTYGSGWPITGASFALMPKLPSDPKRARATLEFFDWAFKNGAEPAIELGYVMLPQNVLEQVFHEWHSKIKDASGKAIWQKPAARP